MGCIVILLSSRGNLGASELQALYNVPSLPQVYESDPGTAKQGMRTCTYQPLLQLRYGELVSDGELSWPSLVTVFSSLL